jgi:hypothetical protein
MLFLTIHIIFYSWTNFDLQVPFAYIAVKCFFAYLLATIQMYIYENIALIYWHMNRIMIWMVFIFIQLSCGWIHLSITLHSFSSSFIVPPLPDAYMCVGHGFRCTIGECMVHFGLYMPAKSASVSKAHLRPPHEN